MKKVVYILFLFLYVNESIHAQDSKEVFVYKEVDSLFREDQLYISVSYNLVQNRPSGFKQFGFSQGFTAGFLRDFPISNDRNWAIAPGVGYAFNNVKQFVNENEIFGGNSLENIRTTIITHGIEFPIELRWRNATPTNHKFWRIYAGFKALYILDASIKVEFDSGTEKNTILDDINRWQYGAYVSFGFNTWNPYIYYGLNPIFKDGTKMRNFNLGFMFYIL